MSEKSADAFRTISEVADELDLPQHVLRFWETRFSQIRPMKRGGGRRYYRPTDVDLLKGIKHLLYVERYTIKGVQKLLREHGNQIAVSIANGDKMALAELVARNTPETEEHRADEAGQASAASDRSAELENLVVGKPEVKTRGLFGLGKSTGPAMPVEERGSVSKDNRALLQEALFDLLECKRLLDQAR